MATITRTRDGVTTTTNVGESVGEFRARQTAKRISRRGFTKKEEEFIRSEGVQVGQVETKNPAIARVELDRLLRGDTSLQIGSIRDGGEVRPITTKEGTREVVSTVGLIGLEESLRNAQTFKTSEIAKLIDTAGTGKSDTILRIGKFQSGAIIPLKQGKAFKTEGLAVKREFEIQDLKKAERLLAKGSIDTKQETKKSLAKKLFKGRRVQEGRKAEANRRLIQQFDNINLINTKVDNFIDRYIEGTTTLKNPIYRAYKKELAKALVSISPPMIAINIGGLLANFKTINDAGITREVIGKGFDKSGKFIKDNKVRLISPLLTTSFQDYKDTAEATKELSKKVIKLSKENLNPKTPEGFANLVVLSVIFRPDRLLTKGSKKLLKISKKVAKDKKVREALTKAGIKITDKLDDFTPSRLFSSKSGRKGGKVRSLQRKAERKAQRISKQVKKSQPVEPTKFSRAELKLMKQKGISKKKAFKKKPKSKGTLREQKKQEFKQDLQEFGLIGKGQSKGKLAKKIRLKETFKEKITDLPKTVTKTTKSTTKKSAGKRVKSDKLELIQKPKGKIKGKTKDKIPPSTQVVKTRPLSSKSQRKIFRKQKVKEGKAGKVSETPEFTQRGVRTGREGKRKQEIINRLNKERAKKEPYSKEVTDFFILTEKQIPKPKSITPVKKISKPKIKVDKGRKTIKRPKLEELPKFETKPKVDNALRGLGLISFKSEKETVKPKRKDVQGSIIRPLPTFKIAQKPDLRQEVPPIISFKPITSPSTKKKTKSKGKSKPSPIIAPKPIIQPLFKPKTPKLRKPKLIRKPKTQKPLKPKLSKLKPLPIFKPKKVKGLSEQITFFTQTIAKPSKVEGKRTKGLLFGEVELFTGAEKRGFK